MKFVEPEPSHLIDPAVAACKLVEIANAIEPAQDGRIYIELVNSGFLKGAARRTSSAPVSHAPSS